MNGEGTGVSIIVGLTDVADLGIHAAITSVNDRRVNCVVEIRMSESFPLVFTPFDGRLRVTCGKETHRP